jgi:hypothetical protein
VFVVELGDLLADLREGERGASSNGLKRMNPKSQVQGVYIPQLRLSVVPTWAWYYRGVRETETENSYR